MSDDKRLIEDYLPIEVISAESSREKSVRKGHISTLHLWWARRPLVACRAAVYGTLVPASRFVPNGGSDETKKSLGRANSAKFVKALCKYPGEPRTIQEAQRHILIAHADRLTQELADWKSGNTSKPGWVGEFGFSPARVTIEDITAGRAPRPRVLDMFAGGGAIPLEALRMGCEAYAVDLNPVAHIIQLCTLVYPQKYGKPDTTARGMTGPKNAKGEATWGGLAKELHYWGKLVLGRVRAEIGDLYPLIPDPRYKGKKPAIQRDWFKEYGDTVPAGYLMPIAYLWTRTVTCKNPSCGAVVPLVKQTWLCKKKGRCVAMMVAPRGKKQVRFEIVEAKTERELGFDPAGFSNAGNAACPFCGTVADSDYVMAQGCAGLVGQQLIAVACTSPGVSGKVYAEAEDIDQTNDAKYLQSRLSEVTRGTGLSVPTEKIGQSRPSPNARGLTAVTRHGVNRFCDLFNMRQQVFLLALAKQVKTRPWSDECEEDRSRAIAAYLTGLLDKVADYGSSFCRWISQTEAVADTFARHALAMLWDYAELNPLGTSGSNAESILNSQIDAVMTVDNLPRPATVMRGSATDLPSEVPLLDAVITDPPYYDNVPYADVSDFFYVWQKQSIRDLFPQHFSSELTPKKKEATALSSRHGGDMAKANAEYEQMMQEAFAQAHSHLKDNGQLVVVYAHKTTLGWATLVQALKSAGFIVEEAWPFDTERGARLLAIDTSALASSIFLVARKRDMSSKVGNYETDVVPELAAIVRERVDTLWEMGISGADLVIACVGAGLRAFTKYTRVEYGNGEEVAAERFLAEVETEVLETVLGKLSKTVGTKNGQTTLAGLDPATRFYVLWRYTYGAAELDAGEAIIFANGTHVELDGQHSLTQGNRALLEKKKSKYRLHDYTERGDENALGQPAEDGTSAPTVDALHRLLWLLEHKPLKIPQFLTEAKPNVERLRLVAQALGGPALSGGELSDVSSTSEQSALGKLLANWNAVMVGKAAVEDRRTGQETLFKA